MPNENKTNQDAANQPTALSRLKAALSTVVGIALMLVCLVLAFYTWRFTANAAAASGTVTRLNAGGSHLQVRFTTAAGDVVEYAQNGLIGGYQAEDTVEVLYDPRDPKASAVINSFGALWGFTLIGFVSGAAFVGLGRLALRRPDLVG